MSVSWPIVRLGDVLRLDLDIFPVDAATSYPMVGVLSFGRGLFVREAVECGNTSYRHFLRLKAEHVVMSQLFGWEGALALCSEEFAGKYVSPQFPTFLCDDKRLDRGFLGWFMKRQAFWDDLGTRASGMGDRRRTLNPECLFASEIPLPHLNEQQLIVRRINELASEIETARKLRQEATEEAEALCRAILASDADAIPTPMRELVRLRAPDVEVKTDGVYQFAGVYCFGRGVFRGQQRTGLEFAYPRLTTLHTGNFVYPKLMAWEGALAVVPPECDGCVVSTEFPVFEVLEDLVLPEVLDTYFRTPSVWPEIAGESTGTNVRRRRLNPGDFLNYRLPLPTRRIQERLRAVRAEVSGLHKVNAQTTAELDALLPAILDQAFKGEL